MKVVDWASFDAKCVPTEVLRSIKSTIDAELTIRSREERARRTDLRDMGAARSDYKKHPKPHHLFNRHWLDYLDDLVGQDWTGLYRDGCAERRYYVYAHVQPSGKAIRHQGIGGLPLDLPGLPFYIGKGTGDRAFDLNRNQGHGAILRELAAAGVGAKKIVHVLKDGMTEAEALALEAKLIYFFGTKYQRGRRGILVNLEAPRTPFD